MRPVRWMPWLGALALLAGLAAPATAQDRWETELRSARHAPETIEPLVIHDLDLRAGTGLLAAVDVRNSVLAQYPNIASWEPVETVSGALRFSRARVVAPGAATWFVIGGDAFVQRSRTYGGPNPQFPFLVDVGRFVFRAWESGAYLTLGLRWSRPPFGFHVQLDRAIGLLAGHAQFDLRWDAAGAAAVVRKHGSDDYAVAATRWGLEVGWPLMAPRLALVHGAPLLTMRFRTEWVLALGRPRLRFHGDANSSATYNPSSLAFALSLGLAF